MARDNDTRTLAGRAASYLELAVLCGHVEPPPAGEPQELDESEADE
jgi:hypothetical protein